MGQQYTKISKKGKIFMKKLFLLMASLILGCSMVFSQQNQTVTLGAGDTATVNCIGDHVTINQPNPLQVVVNCIPATPPPTTTNIVVDHNSIQLFEQIPASFITAARTKELLMRTASVGQNISFGLDCLVNNSSNSCRTGFTVPASSIPIVQHPEYSRSNWLFEFRGNPGWYGKVNDFINNFNTRKNDFDFVSWKQSYVDDSTIYKFWLDTSLPDIFNIEALTPQSKIIFWTAAISKLSLSYLDTFNEQMRVYTMMNNRPLIDLADIESHRPDGSTCFNTNGQIVICSEYNSEVSGGHLTNGMASIRVAKAVWVMMARLSGWNPQQ